MKRKSVTLFIEVLIYTIGISARECERGNSGNNRFNSVKTMGILIYNSFNPSAYESNSHWYFWPGWIFSLATFSVKGIRDSRYSETKQFNDSRTIALLPENIRNQIIIHYDDITDGNLLSDLLQRET